jgi:23S rRNA (cytidine1920-2'-O)/16S rRNA (cytidine1409-2'-O)-methyltransferase
LIGAGRVQVRGTTASKAATGVEHDTPIRVVSDEADPGYASRGGHKLAGALAAFETAADSAGPAVQGLRCLDAGASTGGFTDVLLRRGAQEVAAVDVGYGQLTWALRSDPRVHVFDRTNVRAITPADIGGPCDLTVADLSFISLKLVLPALSECTRTDLIPMVKPQFEVGRDRLGSGGVVRDPNLRAEAVLDVAQAAARLGWGTKAVVASPLPGPSGNVEFFLWLRRDAPAVSAEMVAVAAGATPDTAMDTALDTMGGQRS